MQKLNRSRHIIIDVVAFLFISTNIKNNDNLPNGNFCPFSVHFLQTTL
jgi:hypothetical protein